MIAGNADQLCGCAALVVGGGFGGIGFGYPAVAAIPPGAAYFGMMSRGKRYNGCASDGTFETV